MRAVLREAGRQGLVNTVIHWSPHTESRNPACSQRVSTIRLCPEKRWKKEFRQLWVKQLAVKAFPFKCKDI